LTKILEGEEDEEVIEDLKKKKKRWWSYKGYDTVSFRKVSTKIVIYIKDINNSRTLNSRTLIIILCVNSRFEVVI
jgi:hypothetical protein